MQAKSSAFSYAVQKTICVFPMTLMSCSGEDSNTLLLPITDPQPDILISRRDI